MLTRYAAMQLCSYANILPCRMFTPHILRYLNSNEQLFNYGTMRRSALKNGECWNYCSNSWLKWSNMSAKRCRYYVYCYDREWLEIMSIAVMPSCCYASGPTDAPAVMPTPQWWADSYATLSGRFYQCVSGYPHSLPCPTGLFFDTNNKQCNFRKLAVCGPKPRE